MIKEAYCSFEVAKLLKEKGFNELCTAKYCTDGRFDRSFYYYKNSEINKDAYNAPTLQMAMRWLREVHKIHIVIGWLPNSKLFFTHICDMNSGYPKRNKHEYTSYEEAVEEALKYTLENLI